MGEYIPCSYLTGVAHDVWLVSTVGGDRPEEGAHGVGERENTAAIVGEGYGELDPEGSIRDITKAGALVGVGLKFPCSILRYPHD